MQTHWQTSLSTNTENKPPHHSPNQTALPSLFHWKYFRSQCFHWCKLTTVSKSQPHCCGDKLLFINGSGLYYLPTRTVLDVIPQYLRKLVFFSFMHIFGESLHFFMLCTKLQLFSKEFLLLLLKSRSPIFFTVVTEHAWKRFLNRSEAKNNNQDYSKSYSDTVNHRSVSRLVPQVLQFYQFVTFNTCWVGVFNFGRFWW